MSDRPRLTPASPSAAAWPTGSSSDSAWARVAVRSSAWGAGARRAPSVGSAARPWDSFRGSPGSSKSSPEPGSRLGCSSQERRRSRPGRGLLPVRGSGLHGRRRQPPDRQRRPRIDRHRRPPGRARRGADGHAPECPGRGGCDQPARRGGGAACGPTATPRVRRARAGRAGHRRPRARCRWRAGLARRPARSCSAAEVGPRDLGAADSPTWSRSTRARSGFPRWYRPNPGRAASWRSSCSPARVSDTRMSRITNQRWALSAFGTATSAALGAGDTVYSVTPPYHPSGSADECRWRDRRRCPPGDGPRFDAATFWEEVRRYGVTVASYTWTMLHDLVAAPPQPGERHHPVRLFIGSGMPRGLWRRVRGALRAGARARVLCLHRGRGDPGQPAGRQARRDGPPAPGQLRGQDRPVRHRGRRSGAGPTSASPAMRHRRGRDAAGAGPAQRPAERGSSAGCVRPGTPGWSPAICSGRTATVTSGGWTTSAR